MATGAVITRNGKAYDGGDVRFQIDGVDYYGVKEATYGNEQEHQLNFSGRNEATSWSRGKKTPGFSFTLEMADVIALEERFGNDFLKVPPFTVTAVLGDEFNTTVTDRCLVKFKNNGRDLNGEMNLAKQFEMFALKVELNV